jgi:hypothetical protein
MTKKMNKCRIASVSACNPEKYSRPEDQFRVPYATSLAVVLLLAIQSLSPGALFAELRNPEKGVAPFVDA